MAPEALQAIQLSVCAGSGEQRLMLACGVAPTGSLRLASLATALEVTTSTTLQMEVPALPSIACQTWVELLCASHNSGACEGQKLCC